VRKAWAWFDLDAEPEQQNPRRPQGMRAHQIDDRRDRVTGLRRARSIGFWRLQRTLTRVSIVVRISRRQGKETEFPTAAHASAASTPITPPS